jgi:hypothetical protein
MRGLLVVWVPDGLLLLLLPLLFRRRSGCVQLRVRWQRRCAEKARIYLTVRHLVEAWCTGKSASVILRLRKYGARARLAGASWHDTIGLTHSTH